MRAPSTEPARTAGSREGTPPKPYRSTHRKDLFRGLRRPHDEAVDGGRPDRRKCSATMASDPAASGGAPKDPRRRVALGIWAVWPRSWILLVLDGLGRQADLVRGLTSARAELTVGIESIVTGDPEAAAPHFAAAREAADHAVSSVGHPSLGLAGLLPIVGNNIEATSAVAEASLATAEAGTIMVKVARDLAGRHPDPSSPHQHLDIRPRAPLPGMGSVVSRLETRCLARGSRATVSSAPPPHRDTLETSLEAPIALRVRFDAARHGDVRRPHRPSSAVPALGFPCPRRVSPTVGVLLVDAAHSARADDARAEGTHRLRRLARFA